MQSKTSEKLNAESSEHNSHVKINAENDEMITINRKIYNHTEFLQSFSINALFGFSLIEFIKSSILFTPNKSWAKKFLYNRIPALKMIKNYKQENILPDFLSGMTVGIMHIPQGMAYSLLASLPPIYGLYTSFYPVSVYWLFGTSRQLSIGSFAVISLMVSATITDLESKYVPPEDFNNTLVDGQNVTYNYLSTDREQAKIMIAMANAFWVGIFQLGMSFFQLGSITSYLSEPLLNSFLVGCAIHVLTSQIKFVLGLHGLTSYVGAFKIPKTYAKIFSKLPETNIATLIVAAISITVLATVKIHINERFAKKMPVPFPIELVIVVFGTIISHFSGLNKRFHVDIVGHIPSGLPSPSIPPFFLINDMLFQTFMTALIAFVINYSLADFFSKKHHYKINTNQELLAYGISNVYASFFPCFSSGASLARSCVQDNSGGRTQIVAIYSCMIIGFVLMFLAPLFKELPHACLASIIIVALRTLLMQISQLPFYWKVNKLEFLLFLVTFLSTTFLDVGLGLATGVLFNIFLHILKSSKPCGQVLGNIPGTELYKDIKLYKVAKELDDIKIIRVETELHAMNSIAFKKSIYQLCGINPTHYLNMKIKQEKKSKKKTKSKYILIQSLIQKLKKNTIQKNKVNAKEKFEHTKINYIGSNFEVANAKMTIEENYWTEYERNERAADKQTAETESQIAVDDLRVQMTNEYETKENNIESNQCDLSLIELPFKYLVIDCSPIYFIDTVGCKIMKQLINNFNEIGIVVYLADCTDAFRERFELIETATNEKQIDFDIIYLSIHDACLKARKINKLYKKY